MTPLQIVRTFWPSVELRIDYDSSPGWDGQLVIRDPACRRDVAAWIMEHEREIMDEMKAGGRPDKIEGENPWKRTKTKQRS